MTTKSLLAASILCFASGLAFAAGVVHVNKYVELYVMLPLGAVFFGLYLVSNMLKKELAEYDREQHRIHGSETLSRNNQPAGPPDSQVGTPVKPS